MTLLDGLIILIILAALLRGYEEGLVHQLFSSLGFFFGLFVGSLLQPHVVSLVHSPWSKIVIALATTLGCAFLFLFVGEILGIIVKHRLRPQDILNRTDNILGSVLAGIGVLIVVWLSAAVITALPYADLRQEVRSSAIVSLLAERLPEAPNIIAGLGRLIAPNGFPNVFIGREPTPQPVHLPPNSALAAAVRKDRASVVKIRGLGCGGVVYGSGFVVNSGFVVTNAHVVAGIHFPTVIDGNGTHPATTVWFDPDLDLAVLSTSNLSGRPLPLNTALASRGQPAGVLGYPGGGSFQADRAAILDEFTAIGRNIYNEGRTARDVYSVEATIIPGNSGGPLINLQGQVIGIIFATSTTYKNVGYALTLTRAAGEIAQAERADRPVSTGSCTD